MGNRGIVVDYSIDRDYFVYGDAYRLKIGINSYINAICIKVEKESVTFGYHNKNSFDTLTLKIEDLIYKNSYDIRRMKVDNEKGKFNFEN